MTRPIPPTAFGQPNGNKPNVFSSENQPARERRHVVGATTLEMIQANGRLATTLRNRFLRATARITGDIEHLIEGGDPGAAAREAAAHLTPEVRALMRDAEAAAGLSTPSPEDTSALMGELDVRLAAMAAMELIRQAAAQPAGDVIDVTPEKAEDDDV